MTKRRKIDVAEGADRPRGAAGAGDGRRSGASCEVPPEPGLRLEEEPQEQAGRAFDRGVGREAEADRERAIERLHAKIGQLTVERDF